MKLQSCIERKLFHLLSLLCIFICGNSNAVAQRVAVLAPDGDDVRTAFADKLRSGFSAKLKMLDTSLARTAYDSIAPATPFNLTTREGKRLGETIGCDFLVLIQGATLRRAALRAADYHEAYAAIYLIDGRDGQLIDWRLHTFSGGEPAEAERELLAATNAIAQSIESIVAKSRRSELNLQPESAIEEVPDVDYMQDKRFRPPMPFRRIKPEYTRTAYLYSVKGTVDVTVDIDAEGKIIATKIVRWAGYDLEQAVLTAVNQMSWRPAERDGKLLPMRVLLRYNFLKIEKE